MRATIVGHTNLTQVTLIYDNYQEYNGQKITKTRTMSQTSKLSLPIHKDQ